MNKYKKIATAVVATVMAGTMVASLAACAPKEAHRPSGPNTEQKELDADLTPQTDENGKLTYTEGTTLNMNVGNGSNDGRQSIAFGTAEISGTVTLPDGKQYSQGDLKPAWAEMGRKLKVTFVDKYQRLGGTDQLKTPHDQHTTAQYDVVTAGLSAIVTYSSDLLNLSNYLSYMPNYAKFLEDNPVSYLSLAADGTTGDMYAAPYFDGMNDIEKYELVRKDWVRLLLDTEATAATSTFAASSANKPNTVVTNDTAVKPYMGTTGKWSVDAAQADGTVTTVVVNYDAVKGQLADATSALYKAVALDGVTVQTESGNIVDIMNNMIHDKAGAVTGQQLAKVLQAYIDVAYQKTDGTKFYTKRSDVFNGVNAAWDVDLYVAMMRTVVASKAAFEAEISGNTSLALYGVMGREATNQRRSDLTALAGELYGIRGLESRFENTYIDANGEIKDARLDAKTFELLNNMNAMAKEGLLYIGDTSRKGTTSYASSASDVGPVAFSMHDYTQTQTAGQIQGKVGVTGKNESWDFAPVVTPVSTWDVDGDGNRTDIMRFTESWRSTKNTGFAVFADAVRGDANKLSAVLAFIDYLFSNDGQLLMTYAFPSSSKDAQDGWWKGDVVADKTPADVADVYVAATNYAPAQYKMKSEYMDKYFIYDGKVYNGLEYTTSYTKRIPEVTTNNKNFYEGNEVNGYTQGAGGTKRGDAGNYTDYAREYIGSTLPVGNKDQGYEYQATAKAALNGSKIVGAAIKAGVIKHVVPVLESASQSTWYLIAPTALPMSKADQDTWSGDTQSELSGTLFRTESKAPITNIFVDIMFYGLGNTSRHYSDNNSGYPTIHATGAEVVSYITTKGMDVRFRIMEDGWYMLNQLYHVV